MKTIFKKLLGVTLLSVITNAYAVNTTCPPTNIMLDHAQFHSAHRFSADRWILFSNSFSYKNTAWSVQYVVTLPNVHSEDQALKKGQERFSVNSNYLLNEPYYTPTTVHRSCAYTPFGHENVVMALN